MLGNRRLRSLACVIVAAATAGTLVTFSAPAQAAAIPDTPVGLAPSGGGSAPGIPRLSWTRSTGATSYDVQVSTSPTFSSVTWSTTTVNSQVVPNSQLAQGLDYWRVRAKNGAGASAWATESFTRTAVDAPTGLSPQGDTLQEPDNPPVLSWKAVPGATSYTVQLSTDSSFVDTAAITTYTTKLSTLVVSSLRVPNTYYWRVQAGLGAGLTTGWSDSASYVLEGLTAPSLVSPSPDSVDTNVQDVVLHWTPVPGANSYDVQVSTDQDFLTLVDSRTGVTGTSYSPPTTLNNDQYYWRVRPVDASGNKLDWSQVAVWHFRRNWPDQPALQYPGEGATVGDPFYYQWSPVHRASSYQVQLSTASDFSAIADTCSTVETTLVPAQDEGNAADCMPTAQGTYYWRVLALDGPEGVQSDVISAQVRHFTYSPEMVTQVSPDNGATVKIPTMAWNPVAGAAKYKVTWADTAGGNPASVTTAATSFTPTGALAVGHTYRWQVQTVSGDGRVGASVLSGSQPTFTVEAQDSAIASTPEPTDNPTALRFPTLTWTPVVGATSYKLYARPTGTIGFSPIQTTFAYPAGGDTGTSYLTTGTYDWFVEAYSGSTFLSDSNTYGTFTISAMADAANARAGLTGNGITGHAGTTVDTCAATLPNECQNLRQTPVLSWDPDPNAGYYKLYFSNDGEMTNLVSGYNPITVYGNMWADTSALPDSQAGSAYFWEAVPCRSNGACAPLEHAGLAFNKLSNQVVLHSAQSNNPSTCGQPADVCNDVRLSWDDYLDTEQSADTADTVLKTSAATTEARSYKVQTSTDPNFQSAIETVTVDQTTFTSYATTYPEGPVYWRVQAIDGAGNALAWSETGTFTKTSPAPTLTSPDAGATQSGTQAFTWDPATFAKSYNVEIYKNDDLIGQPANRVISATGLLQAAYTPTAPLPVSSTPYTWRVRRVDAKNRLGAWSALQEFTVSGAAPTLVSPAEGASVAPSDSVFSWQAVDGAATYRFERRALGTTTVTETATTPALAWAPTSAIAGGSWQWRVSALDTSNQVMASSNWRDFAVTDHPVATTDVSIVGSGAVGTVLTVQPPTWSLPGVTTTYQWKRDTSGISGQTGTQYTVTPSDVGKSLTVVATGTKDGYKSGTSTSNAIAGTAGPAPVPSVKPSISGAPKVGLMLTADHGTWSGTVSKYAYQWLRNGNPIAGATGSSYRVQTADAAQRVAVLVTVTETGLAPGVATSNQVTIAKLPSTTTASLKSGTIRRTAHGKLNVTVWVSGISQPTGELTVKQGTRTLTSVALKARYSGHKSITLPRLGRGKHRLKVVYSGTATISRSKSKAVVLKVN